MMGSVRVMIIPQAEQYRSPLLRNAPQLEQDRDSYKPDIVILLWQSFSHFG